MGVYKRIVITDNGNELISQALAGEKIIRFLRASTSDYSYPDGTNFAQLTNLQGEKQSVIPSDVEVTDSLVSIRTLFENADIITPYLIQNIGLYAADGEGEILFGIAQAETPDQMPAYNGVAPSSFIYNIHIEVSQAQSITVEVSPAGSATKQEVIEIEKRVDKLYRSKNITLLSAGWTEEAPYVQTVNLEGVTADTVLDGSLYIPAGTTAAQEKVLIKAASCVSYFDTGDGSITVTCIGKKPAVDFQIQLKGV